MKHNAEFFLLHDRLSRVPLHPKILQNGRLNFFKCSWESERKSIKPSGPKIHFFESVLKPKE